VRPSRLTLVGLSAPTIAALVEAELKARGEALLVLDLVRPIHRFCGETLVEVHVDEPLGRPELVIDTEKESVAEAAETVLAYIDGRSLV
jgi:adenylylsulfate kinase-like enzyme